MDVHLPVIILNAEQKGTGATFKPLMSKNFKLASKDKVFVTNLSCKSTMWQLNHNKICDTIIQHLDKATLN